MEKVRYNKLNQYLKDKFGERVLKICVNGGFTCPNRDGSKSTKGCLFCSQLGSGEHLYNCLSVKEQIDRYFDSYKADRANKFIVYFQSFTNTYADINYLKNVYSQALSDRIEIVGLEIATRPDCITREICELLSEFNKKVCVVVELGLQTSNDITGEVLNRQYTSQDFINAVYLLNEFGIEVVAHMMVGLPGETHEDIANTVQFINSTTVGGIKIHSTYVVRGAGLEALFNNNCYTPPTQEYYLDELEYILTHLRPNIVIHRLTSDPPKDLLISPEWCLKKKPVLNGIERRLKEKDLYQGIFYKK